MVRHSALICQAATEATSTQNRVKFKRTVRIVRRRAANPAFFPEHRQRAAAQVMADITRAKNLDPPRRDRTYLRVVKRAQRNSYRVKTRRPWPAGTMDRPRLSW